MSASTTYSDLHIRMNSGVKKEAEAILDDLGVAPSSAINMFYRQVIAHNGLPFRVVKRSHPVPDMDSMTTDEINARLSQAESAIAQGKFRPADEVFQDILGSKRA